MEYYRCYRFFDFGCVGVPIWAGFWRFGPHGHFACVIRRYLFCVLCGSSPQVEGATVANQFVFRYDVTMENTIILQLAGFVICFILLFFFTAKYRAALAQETDFESSTQDNEPVTVAQPPVYKPRAEVLNTLQGSSELGLADIKERVKELQYRLEELKAVYDKQGSDITKQLARLETRLSTFEQEYMTKLQPTLLGLIKDLENIKVSESKK